jgi:TonB family protein
MLYSKKVLNKPQYFIALTLIAILISSSASALSHVNYRKTASNHTFTQTDTVLNGAEVYPGFPGGEQALNLFLRSNIDPLKTITDKNVSRRVFVSLIVEKDGSLTNMKILQDPGNGLGDEALRVLKLSPKWTPGLQNGVAVRVRYTVPVNFNLATNALTANATAQSNDNRIFNAVEVSPSFPGGTQGFSRFLSENIRYPKLARENNVTGRVFIQFVVERDGSLTDMKVLRDPGSGLGDEALRVLNLCPKWTPGLQNGQAVRVQYTVPINFSTNGQ